MRPINKEKIIKEGTMREKIKLYFTHLALINTVEDHQREDIKPLLTDKDIQAIYTKIKEPRDIKYYDTLRRYTKVFIMIKPKITSYKYQILNKSNEMRFFISMKKREQAIERKAIEDKEQYIKNMLRGLNEIINNEAVNRLSTFLDENKAEKINYEKKAKKQDKELLEKIKIYVAEINDLINQSKGDFEESRYLINKKLPLQPYKEFIAKEEKIIKNIIKIIKEDFIEGNFKEIRINTPTNPEDINGEFYIYSWEDIEIELNENNLYYYNRLAYD